MPLKVVSKADPSTKVPGEDWDVLMWHNGKLFAAGYASGTISVLDKDLKLITQLEAHEYPIYHLAPGPNKTFFTTSTDCTIKEWNETDSGQFVLLQTLSDHEEPIRRLRYDGNRLYSGDELGKIKIWEDGKVLATLETMEEIWDMIVNDDQIITCRHLDVVINSVTQREDRVRLSVKNTLAGKGPLIIEGDKLCFVERNGSVIYINDACKNGNPNIAKLSGHKAMVNGMQACNNTLFSGGGDNKIIAWSLETMKKVGETSCEGYVNAITVNPDDGTVYVGGQDKFLVSLKLQ